ncbi:MAG: hypothetical protein NTZ80_03350 [Patescibacteria group bacterium]|nr:hypothetical protein [Patescibacteria group bacterium]
MYIKDINFSVEFSDFAERHYCKNFFKKYKSQWIATRQTIEFNLQRAYAVFRETSLIDLIKYSVEENTGIFKMDFRVAGTNVSPKASGNRVIFALCNDTGEVKILLVYGKGHCGKNRSETEWILGCVKGNFLEYKGLC